MFRKNNQKIPEKKIDSQLDLYAEFDRADKLIVADESAQLTEQAKSYDFEAANLKFKENIELSEMRLKERKDKIALNKFSNLMGKSFTDIANETKKEKLANEEELKEVREEIKNEFEYPDKPISADDDFTKPFIPAEEYYGRWK